MNRFVIVATLTFVIVGMGIYIFSSSDTEIKNYPPKAGPIVAFGDSLVQGVGASDGSDFVSVLSNKLVVPIINLGVPGDTTRDGILRVPEVLEEDPGIVILLSGGNDFLRRIPKEETFNNLKIIIETLQRDGVLVVLLGVRGGILADGYGSEFKAVARETGSVYVDDVLDGIFGNAQLMYDGIHPNEKGYALIAEKVYNEMEGLMR